MSKRDVCNVVSLVTEIELYWPYVAYCFSLTTAYAAALWRSAADDVSIRQFASTISARISRALWRQLLKLLSIWLLGGAILLNVASWICAR